MPELPEVETVRRSLLPYIVGKTIASVEVLHPKTIRGYEHLVDALPGHTITDVTRRAKLLMIHCDGLEDTVCVHLKMTGQLIFVDKKAKGGGGHTLTKTDLELPHKHTRLALHFTDGSTLYFNDMRLFGYVRLLSPPELSEALAEYGIEPGLDHFTEEAFLEALKGRKTAIKAVLLNQALIAGLGNIYADEACFLAKVKPQRRAHRLTKTEKHDLYQACQTVLADAIAAGGTTFYSFAHADGKAGSYLDELNVFARQDKPCRRCAAAICKTVCAGRGTHYCPKCQK